MLQTSKTERETEDVFWNMQVVVFITDQPQIMLQEWRPQLRPPPPITPTIRHHHHCSGATAGQGTDFDVGIQRGVAGLVLFDGDGDDDNAAAINSMNNDKDPLAYTDYAGREATTSPNVPLCCT
jgi:hypothetical protein